MTKQELLALATFTERIAQLTEDLRDEPNHNSNHLASMIAGEIDGVRWCEEELRPLIEALIEDRERLREALGLAHSHCGWAQAQEQASNVRNCAASAAQVLSEALTASDERMERLRGEKL